MKQFKYNLMQRVYLRKSFGNIPVGSMITITGRYVCEGSSLYNIIQGDIALKSEREPVIRNVPEENITSRPPYETLYAVKTELYYRNKGIEDDINTVKYVLGNLDTAKVEFYFEVDKCITLTSDKFRYGKVSLYVPVIKDNGCILDIAEETIDQKFFFDRGV